MLAVIAWKEWRQQIALVIAIVALAGITIAATALTMPHEWAGRNGPRSTGNMWVVLLIGLAFTQGLVTGSMLFAGETEDRTQEFLDQHIGLRSPLWRAKMLSGVSLVGVSSIVLGGLIIILDLGHAFLLPACVWISFDALVWSALCSVNRKTTFGAIGVALAVLVVVDGFTLGFLFNDDSRIMYFVVKIPLLMFALWLSWRLYCSADLHRVVSGTEPYNAIGWLAIPMWFRISLWHIWARRKGTLALLVVGPIVTGWAALRGDPLLAWPIGTFLVGCIAGWGVFADEQAEGTERFLGDQRFPLWKLWLGKTLPLFALTMVGFALVFFFVALILLERPDASRSNYAFAVYLEGPIRGILPSLIFALLGFAFAQFAGQQTRKMPVAVFLTLALGGTFAAFWYPSLFAGLPAWRVGLLALAFSMATVWFWRHWTSGRLHDRGGIMRLCSIVVASLLYFAATIAIRVAEISNVSEPFDIEAYWKSLTRTPDDAGAKLQAAGLDLRERIKVADEQFGNPELLEPDPLENWQHVTWSDLIGYLSRKGVPKQPGKYSEYVHFVFDDPWAKQFAEGALAPPDRLQATSTMQLWSSPNDSTMVLSTGTRLFLIRSMIHLHEGKKDSALADLKVALAATRHGLYRSWGTLATFALDLQIEALATAQQMIDESQSDRELLRGLLAMLNAHAGMTGMPARRDDWSPFAVPSFTGIVKSSYFAPRGNPFVAQRKSASEVEFALANAPWEQARTERIRNQLFARMVEQAEENRFPLPNQLYRDFVPFFRSSFLRENLREAEYRSVARIVYDDNLQVFWFLDRQRTKYAEGLLLLRGLTLSLAASAYEEKHGRPIASPDDLVPEFFETLPENPFIGESWGYRVSTGELDQIFLLGQQQRGELISTRPGQGMIIRSSTLPDTPRPISAIPIPMSSKK